MAVVVLVSAAAWAAAGCGSSSSDGEASDARTALRVERAVAPTGEGAEVVVSVEDAEQNVPDTADGRRSVTLVCVDSAGKAVARGRHPWPFTDTDDGLLAAHVHQDVPPAGLDALRRCRLEGTRGPLSGRVVGPSGG